MNRRQEREEAFLMLFEAEFAPEKSAEEIYDGARDARDVEESLYVRAVLDGVRANRAELDALIDAHSNGWKKNRLSGVARAAILHKAVEIIKCNREQQNVDHVDHSDIAKCLQHIRFEKGQRGGHDILKCCSHTNTSSL